MEERAGRYRDRRGQDSGRGKVNQADVCKGLSVKVDASRRRLFREVVRWVRQLKNAGLYIFGEILELIFQITLRDIRG